MFEEHEGVKNVMIREWTVYGAPVGAKNISTCMNNLPWIINLPYPTPQWRSRCQLPHQKCKMKKKEKKRMGCCTLKKCTKLPRGKNYPASELKEKRKFL